MRTPDEPWFVSFQIMCKLVTMLSKDTVERLLLMRFCELCSDARLFQVRKVSHLQTRGYFFTSAFPPSKLWSNNMYSTLLLIQLGV